MSEAAAGPCKAIVLDGSVEAAAVATVATCTTDAYDRILIDDALLIQQLGAPSGTGPCAFLLPRVPEIHLFVSADYDRFERELRLANEQQAGSSFSSSMPARIHGPRPAVHASVTSKGRGPSAASTPIETAILAALVKNYLSAAHGVSMRVPPAYEMSEYPPDSQRGDGTLPFEGLAACTNAAIRVCAEQAFCWNVIEEREQFVRSHRTEQLVAAGYDTRPEPVLPGEEGEDADAARDRRARYWAMYEAGTEEAERLFEARMAEMEAAGAPVKRRKIYLQHTSLDALLALSCEDIRAVQCHGAVYKIPPGANRRQVESSRASDREALGAFFKVVLCGVRPEFAAYVLANYALPMQDATLAREIQRCAASTKLTPRAIFSGDCFGAPWLVDPAALEGLLGPTTAERNFTYVGKCNTTQAVWGSGQTTPASGRERPVNFYVDIAETMRSCRATTAGTTAWRIALVSALRLRLFEEGRKRIRYTRAKAAEPKKQMPPNASAGTPLPIPEPPGPSLVAPEPPSPLETSAIDAEALASTGVAGLDFLLEILQADPLALARVTGEDLIFLRTALDAAGITAAHRIGRTEITGSAQPNTFRLKLFADSADAMLPVAAIHSNFSALFSATPAYAIQGWPSAAADYIHNTRRAQRLIKLAVLPRPTSEDGANAKKRKAATTTTTGHASADETPWSRAKRRSPPDGRALGATGDAGKEKQVKSPAEAPQAAVAPIAKSVAPAEFAIKEAEEPKDDESETSTIAHVVLARVVAKMKSEGLLKTHRINEIPDARASAQPGKYAHYFLSLQKKSTSHL